MPRGVKKIEPEKPKERVCDVIGCDEERYSLWVLAIAGEKDSQASKLSLCVKHQHDVALGNLNLVKMMAEYQAINMGLW